MQNTRYRLRIYGAVQGVGFRPFVYRLAQEEGLSGVVRNSAQGVFVEIEGEISAAHRFCARLQSEHPPLASIDRIEKAAAPTTGDTDFRIITTSIDGDLTAGLTPDAATCADCMADVLNPNDRRFNYAFTNCTNCGPRYSILEALPYDRANTTMKAFAMCDACAAEYHDPSDRRFHAQPIACPACGPQLSLLDPGGVSLTSSANVLAMAAQKIRDGCILAVKGLGGFHLVCDARNDAAVLTLRRRKSRPRKPFAVMFECFDRLMDDCIVRNAERSLLESAPAPIVLVRKRADTTLSEHLTPGNPFLGAMLGYTPLHQLLLKALGSPIMTTSGNKCSEPIAFDNDDALDRLFGIADFFLTHDRPIARPVEDSVVRVAAGTPLFLRRARGYAPATVGHADSGASMLALGGHLKNAIAKSVSDNIILSSHIGDLDTYEARRGFDAAVSDFIELHGQAPAYVITDQHDDYYSSKRADRLAGRRFRVQHHRAHVHAVLAEHGVSAPVLGVAWDGAGAGDDGTLWGGEFFLIDHAREDRIAHFLAFPLPGGEAAIRAPKRSALGLAGAMEETHPAGAAQIRSGLGFGKKEATLLQSMVRQKVNTPLTSSVGRLFDGVSAILDLCKQNTFEGEAAMALEFEAEKSHSDEFYQVARVESQSDGAAARLDWRPAVHEILTDINNGCSRGLIARKFHNGLAESIVTCAKHVAFEHVALSGGCFQNRILLEQTIKRLREEGFAPLWPQRVPPNDGGLALGQLHAAARQVKREVAPCV